MIVQIILAPSDWMVVKATEKVRQWILVGKLGVPL